MATFLATLIPVALVLGLLLFGDYGSHRAPDMTPGRVVPVLAIAFLLGPLPALLFGFLVWLVLVAVIVAVTLMTAVLRQPPLRH